MKVEFNIFINLKSFWTFI